MKKDDIAWIGPTESDERENANIQSYLLWRNRPRNDVLFVWIGVALGLMVFWSALVIYVAWRLGAWQ